MLNIEKAKLLRNLIGERNDVTIYEGDCNKILIDDVFPLIEWKRRERALCLLDPYGLHLKWDVIYKAGMMKCIEIFLNFPVMDMNMNALLRNREKVDQRQIDRMNNFWGDESWQKIAYDTTGDLFGHPEKVNNANYVIAQAFKERLKFVAGFDHVPEPIPMRNNINRTIYYIFFAAHKPVSKKIVKSIFEKWGKT